MAGPNLGCPDLDVIIKICNAISNLKVHYVGFIETCIVIML